MGKAEPITNYIEDLNTVYCSIDISLAGNNQLFDRLQLHNLFTNEITKFLDEYGVKYEIEPLAGLGGGGIAESLLNLLRDLWHQKLFHEFIISSIKLLFSKYVISFMRIQFYAIDNKSPRMMICFRLKIDKELTKADERFLDKAVIDRLLNLRKISQVAFDRISAKHPMFLFDQKIGISIYSKSFRVIYSILHERQNKFNDFRLKKAIQSFKIKNNTDVQYGFLRGLAMTKSERDMKFERGFFLSSGKMKTSYFLIP